MNIKYVHTNIVAHDWRALAGFYETVFECRPMPPERHYSGAYTHGEPIQLNYADFDRLVLPTIANFSFG